MKSEFTNIAFYAVADGFPPPPHEYGKYL